VEAQNLAAERKICALCKSSLSALKMRRNRATFLGFAFARTLATPS
jgi:hypothetical protein